MKYRVTCLTPLLVGDGRRLAPIDYMVWKDQVSVLDQTRIFKLLAKGPRLEGYLNQLRRADKLDFASWGGFAQNYADRKVPFENPAYSAYWNKAQGDSLFIPTFAAGTSGPYLPGASIKGALRTGMVFAATKEQQLKEILERKPRRPADALEGATVGRKTQSLAVGDSAPVDYSQFRIYLVRTSTLLPKGSGYALGWKGMRGSVEGNKAEESNPAFAEMAAPGSTFEGEWTERQGMNRNRTFDGANRYAETMLGLNRQYAAWTGLARLGEHVQQLTAKLAEARSAGACLLPLGWGGGLLGKSAWLDMNNPEYRQILQAMVLYNRALESKLPFPKTRKIVFEGNQPSTLPGWVMLEVV